MTFTFEQAKGSLHRLINSHFRKDPRAITRIPCQPDDDDELLRVFLDESQARINKLEAEVEQLKKVADQATVGLVIREAGRMTQESFHLDGRFFGFTANKPELAAYLRKRKEKPNEE